MQGERRLEERLRICAQATREFAAAINARLPELFETIARRTAEVCGDCCALYILSDDGTQLRCDSFYSSDPGATALAATLLGAPLPVAENPLVLRTLASGTPVVAGLAQPFALNPPALAGFVERAGVHSLALMRLFANQRPLGLLLLGRLGTREPFAEADLQLVQIVADHASMAIEKTRAWRREGEARQVLAGAQAAQESLRELQLSEDMLRSFLDAGPDALVVVDGQGEILLVNQQTETLFGFTRAELIGRTVDSLVPARFRSDHALHRATFVADPRLRGMGSGLELFGLRRNGSEFPLEISLSPLKTQHGLIVLSSIRDVSERKATEAALRIANTELEAFSYSVAHDLRAPLRGMNGFAQILLEDHGNKLDADGLDCLREIQENALRMSALIDALLLLARVSRTALEAHRVDLGAIAQDIVAQLRAGEPGRRVEVRIADQLWADADPPLARTLLENLLGNAWKFSAAAKEPVIEVGVADGEQGRTFFVRDNGAGFDMAHADRLFGPFQRLHTASEFPGTGIGLATAQRIVHRHGGRIWAEGAVGQGATFYFTLLRPLES